MKNKKKVILISCICAVVVIAMAAGAVVLMNRSGKVADEQKAPEATQAPVVTATPEPTKDPHEGMVRSNLTGEYITEKWQKNGHMRLLSTILSMPMPISRELHRSMYCMKLLQKVELRECLV